MLGPALALIPSSGKPQASQPAPTATASGQAAPMENASPAAIAPGQATDAGAAPATGGDTGAPSAEAAAGGAASAEGTAAPSAEAAAGASGAAEGDAATGQLRQAGGTLRNAEGADIGSVIITETESGVMHFILDIAEGSVPPGVQRGLHIHETGLCEGPAFESAGGHLAGDKEHGVHSANGPHPGDMPNITMGASGALHVEFFLPDVQMDQILDDDGSAVMIHSDVDDYTSQPSGNAGDRIACAVLEPTS